MPKRKDVPKSSTKDIFLSIVFVTAVVIGFTMIWAVEYSYATNGEPAVLLYESDTDTTFPNIVFGADYPADHWDSFTSMYGYTQVSPYHRFSFPKTPTYLGNSSWGFSVNGTSETNSLVWAIMDLPDLDQWIVSRVKINMTLNGDADLIVAAFISGMNDPTLLSEGASGLNIYQNIGFTGTFLSIDETLTLSQALEIHDDVQGNTKKIIGFSIEDELDDGFASWALEFDVQIYGHPISGWSVTDSLGLALGLSVVLNGVVMVYMTDMVDIGGAVRDLPKKRRGR